MNTTTTNEFANPLDDEYLEMLGGETLEQAQTDLEYLKLAYEALRDGQNQRLSVAAKEVRETAEQYRLMNHRGRDGYDRTIISKMIAAKRALFKIALEG